MRTHQLVKRGLYLLFPNIRIDLYRILYNVSNLLINEIVTASTQILKHIQHF